MLLPSIVGSSSRIQKMWLSLPSVYKGQVQFSRKLWLQKIMRADCKLYNLSSEHCSDIVIFIAGRDVSGQQDLK